jgi:cell division protein FtsI (penicillin-binding protein 3)
VPAARPALVILVSLDTPRGEHNEGGDVAAPVFARIAEQALAHLAVPPEDPDRSLRMAAYRSDSPVTAAYHPAPVAPSPARPTEPARMPELRGLSAREAANLAARQGLLVELKGSGRVVAQTPAPGTELEAVMTCVLTLGRTSGWEGTLTGTTP